MMKSKLTFSVSGIARDNPLYELVNEAHQMLDKEMSPLAGEVREEWSVAKDPNDRTMVVLNLSDNFNARVEAKIEPEELANPREMRYLVLQAWGDLFGDRAENQLRTLRDSNKEEGAANGS